MTSSASKHLLRILPEEGLLREESSFSAPMDWPPAEDNEGPRALRSLSRIIDEGLCHRCGSCVGICPTGVLGLDDEEYPKVVSLSSCTDCDLCVKVCPGDEFDLLSIHRDLYGESWDPKATHGQFLEAFVAHSEDADIRERSTSGGLVTAIILDLLKKGEIDGAVVIASDENVLWKGKPVIARTREEVLAAMKSKYAISPTNSMFAEILKTPGRYVLVGLPCQIHGFRKAARLDPRLAERVVLTIGLFCHAAVEHDAFRIIWEGLGAKTRDAKRFISRIGKHPGTPHIERKDGSSFPVYFGEKQGFRPSSMEIINIIYRLYTPSRCLTCFDATAEFADIAIGDPWMAPPTPEVEFEKGWSFALVRNERAAQICRDLKASGDIHIEPVTRREALHCNEMMSTEKRWRSYRVLETRRRQGVAIPKYGDENFSLPRQSGKQFVKTELHMLTHIFCYIPKFRASILRFMLSDSGYWLLWLNNKRRALRNIIRDRKEQIRRTLFSRE